MSQKQTTTVALIHAAFAAVPNTVDYNQQWESKGNYFDGAITGPDAPLFTVGQLFRTMDKAGRKLLLLGTELGNVVLWTAKHDGKKVVVWQSSNTMFDYVKQSFGDTTSEVTPELFQYLIGDGVTDTVAHRFLNEETVKREVLIAVYQGISEMMNAPDAVVAEVVSVAPVVEAAVVVEAVEVVEPKVVEQAEAPKTAKPEVKQTTQKEEPKMNTNTQTAAKQTTQLTSWGVFWRVSGLAVLIIAAIVAIAFGLHFGAAYIAGLGVSEGVALALTYLLKFVGFIGTFLTMMNGWSAITSVFAKRAPATSAATPAPAAA